MNAYVATELSGGLVRRVAAPFDRAGSALLAQLVASIESGEPKKSLMQAARRFLQFNLARM